MIPLSSSAEALAKVDNALKKPHRAKRYSYAEASEYKDGKGSENRNKSEDLPVNDFVTCGEQEVDRSQAF